MIKLNLAQPILYRYIFKAPKFEIGHILAVQNQDLILCAPRCPNKGGNPCIKRWAFWSLTYLILCRKFPGGWTCCEKQVVTKDRSWHLLLMVRKSQTTTLDVFETLKIMGSTTNLSTGELIPDFWLPSTVWSQNLNHQRLRLFCLRVGIVVLIGNLWICRFRPEP